MDLDLFSCDAASHFIYQRAPLRTRYALCSSLGLHLGAALIIVVHYWALPQPQYGGPASPAIHSYLYTANELKTSAVPPRPVTTPLLPSQSATSPAAATKPTVAAPSTPAAAAQSNAPPTSTAGLPPEALVQLLHNAIQARQIYPASALAMRREGMVSVAFMLSAAGVVTDLHVVKPSGTPSLDSAALAAVRDAAPIQGVSSYLATPRTFQIDIGFELPG